ncbi:type II toxin-antitoxin system VapC family toxin [Sphingomonas adhaesiva]|uniref:type II toxin-antitoxin system VapC family toxin n=1 Tax=Sphingomonas adhaesiva TaxID=28212 RepID=UPI002FFB2E1C
MIVIDTHALVWLIQGDTRLGAEARRIVAQSQAAGAILIPSIVPWEVSMLVDKGRLALGLPVREWFDRVLASRGFGMAPLECGMAIDAGMLPGDIHGDPADRMVIATARHLRLPLLTADRRILEYADDGHVAVIDASR